MQLRAQQIFPRLEPYRIVSDLGLQREEQNGLWFTPHPQHPKHLLQIERDEFVGACDGPTPACPLREWLSTTRKTWGRLRLPALSIQAPLPKSTCTSRPGSHSMRRQGSGVVAPKRRTNRFTD